jgi:uncharacterized protein (TIGR03437 family)
MLGRTFATLSVVLLIGVWSPVFALPALRLVVPPELQQNNGAPQPVWIDAGTDGPANLFFEAINDGDGAFALSVSGGNAAWLLPEALHGIGPCTFDGGQTCTVIAVRFSTAGLAVGAYDGEVEVRDPTAVDSPQRVGIRIYVGTNVPDAVEFFVPQVEGATDNLRFQTAGDEILVPTVMTTSAGPFLSVSSSGLGSVRTVHSHQVVGTYREGLALGANEGSFTISNSSFGPDNRTVPVTLNVTDGPIADPSVDQVDFFTSEGLAEEHGGLLRTIVVSNRGSGDLVVSSVDVATDSGGDWLSVENVSPGVYLARASGAGLAAGLYTGTLSVISNAPNTPCVLAVTFVIFPAGAPDVNFRGAVNGASFSATQPLGPGGIGTVFGLFLSSTTASATTLPLPTEMSGVKVLVNGTPAPLFFTSYGQINFQVPFESALGGATIQVMRDALMSSPMSASIDVRSPGIFRIGIGEYGIVTNFSQGNFPYPPEVGAALGVPAAPANGGDFLVIWCTGLGSVTPGVATGAAASGSPLSIADSIPDVTLGNAVFGPRITPAFVGLAPGFVALFQVNFELPLDMSTSLRTPITLHFGDSRRSNTVHIAVQ